MRKILVGAAWVAVLCFVGRTISGAGEPRENRPPPIPYPPLSKQKLIVGLAVGPPFNIREANGSWTGISVELWRQIAQELGLQYEFREIDLRGCFFGLAQGWLDVAVGPLTITAQREEVCDFTHVYFTSSLAAVVPASRLPESARFLAPILDFNFWGAIFKIALGLFGILTVVALLIWLCERGANAEQFGGERGARGFASALWWTAATMTTVGYGDIAPRTVKGRVIAFVWMFVGLVMVSTFTASIASILTAERLNQGAVIRSLDDLRRLRIGTFADSATARYLETNHIDYQALEHDELFEALKKQRIQAVVYDEPFLRYVVRTQFAGRFTVLPLDLDPQLYAFAVREGSALREPINRVLLRKIHEPAWRDLLYRYLGRTQD